MAKPPDIQRWIGLDIHKSYFVAVGVDAENQSVFGPQRVKNEELEEWGSRHNQPTYAIVVESGKESVLPPLPPLRTGLEIFASSGSSLCSAPCGTWFHNS